MKPIKIIFRFLIVCAIILFILPLILSMSNTRAESQSAVLIVQTRLLNGRSAPRKTASIEARFDYGDTLIETGEWSENHEWVEVEGGETGTVWVHINYVSERTHYTVTNEKHKTVKVRKWPVTGKVTHYIKKGQKIDIEQVVLGWGKTKWGWVDLDYFVEED